MIYFIDAAFFGIAQALILNFLSRLIVTFYEIVRNYFLYYKKDIISFELNCKVVSAWYTIKAVGNQSFAITMASVITDNNHQMAHKAIYGLNDILENNMKKLLKKMVAGTSLEPLSRRIYGTFNRKPFAAEPLEAIDKNHQYDSQTIEVMKRVLAEDSNCIDIGCHEGSILAEILRFSPKGTHFAFEPLPAMYQGLIKTFGDLENLSLYDFALSDTEGVSTFQHVESNPGYSGFLKRRYDRPCEVVKEITVSTNRLDNLIPDDVPVRFIKVDVEGAELQVFRGAANTIRKNLPVIVFEHGIGAADYYGTAPEDVYDLLVSVCGLKLYLMEEWLEKNGGTPLDREAFGKQFSSGSNYYFMAAPQ